MYKIIFIQFILIIICCETSAKSFSYNGCRFKMDNWRRNLFAGLCGTDGVSYRDKNEFKCVQKSEYGKEVNLQLSHEGACFTWPLLWYTVLPCVIVSKRRTDLILTENHFIFV